MTPDKTNFMGFHSSKNNGITVLINGHQIAQVHSSKYIGLYKDILTGKITSNTCMVNY